MQQMSDETTSVLCFPRVTCAARLVLESARIYGDTTLSESPAINQLLASDAVVEGVLSLSGSETPTEVILADLRCRQFSAVNSELERVDCRRLTVDLRARLQHATFSGISDDNQVKFTGASFNDDLNLSRSELNPTGGFLPPYDSGHGSRSASSPHGRLRCE